MIITRFAPSPTGRLHLGHAFAAKFAYDEAKKNGGKFLLRIEDIDPIRCKPEYIDGIYEDLEWLGIRWDEKPRLQSEHMEEYAEVLEMLKNRGFLYPCVCTRAQIKAELERIGHAPHAGETAVYPGTCRGKEIDLTLYNTYAWRFDVQKAAAAQGDLYFTDSGIGQIKVNPFIFGDVVLARKEFAASYHLCSVWDDAIQGVSLVTRGEDLLESTHVQRLLQAVLGLKTPLYHHHMLIKDENGERLAKRKNTQTIADFRQKGYTPEEILNFFEKRR